MPTGYTAIITDKPETTFETFALRCARAFGACIMQRDDSIDTPPHPVVEPQAYYRESLEKAEARARELETMTVKEASARAKADHENKVRMNREFIETHERENKLYRSMLAKVAAWQPPTPEHEGLKKFMREQIEMSVHSGEPYQCDATLLSGKDWLDRERQRAKEVLVRERKAWDEEVKRASDRTAWIQALMASLPNGEERP